MNPSSGIADSDSGRLFEVTPEGRDSLRVPEPGFHESWKTYASLSVYRDIHLSSWKG